MQRHHLDSFAPLAERLSGSVPTLVGIWAHPDDEAFVSGGAMSAAARGGWRVVCVHATRGERGVPPGSRIRPQALVEIREQELKRSLNLLGVSESLTLDYPDGGLIDQPFEDAVCRLQRLMEELRPSMVLTFGPDGFTGHPDHQVLSGWVTAAFRRWGSKDSSLYYATVTNEWRERFVPSLNEFDAFWRGYPVAFESADTDLDLRLNPDLADLKLAALKAHTSQMDHLVRAYGDGFLCAMGEREVFRQASKQPADRVVTPQYVA
ncbi:MAG: PIG-L family deacetylase [Actinomycetota bacterium]|nr:PIG-L family deacetylase [Actinomycetota bacterium]